MMQRVLITGAGGGIGRSLRETLRGVYPVLRLSVFEHVHIAGHPRGQRQRALKLATTDSAETTRHRSEVVPRPAPRSGP